MSKVTSKLQVTVPKAIAERVGIRPGDELEWIVAGGFLKVVPSSAAKRRSAAERLALFDAATRRQKLRQKGRRRGKSPRNRGWTREELYRRGSAG